MTLRGQFALSGATVRIPSSRVCHLMGDKRRWSGLAMGAGGGAAAQGRRCGRTQWSLGYREIRLGHLSALSSYPLLWKFKRKAGSVF